MIVLLLLVYFLVVTISLYGIGLLVTALVEKLIYKNGPLTLKRSQRYKRIAFPSCFMLGILLNVLYFSADPAHNSKTAYIEKQADGFVITIMGKRNLMVHDPISLFARGSYMDSAKFTIPRATGIIDGMEIPNRPGSYKIMQGKAISIVNNKMEVRLFYDNYDDKKAEPSTWNGDYLLEWRK